MVKAIIDIPEHANHIINLVKVKYKLKDKSEAITKLTEIFSEEILEEKLKPEIEFKRKIEINDYIQ